MGRDECSENVEMRQDGVGDCPDHHQHHQPQQEQQLAPGHSALQEICDIYLAEPAELSTAKFHSARGRNFANQLLVDYLFIYIY